MGIDVCLHEGVRYPGAGVTDSLELPCGCWGLNLGPLEAQPVFVTTEPSLQPGKECFKQSNQGLEKWLSW